MSKPTAEADSRINGSFTRIRNDILEAMMRSTIPNSPMRVLLAIMRLSWGYRKPECIPRRGEIARLTGLSKQNTYHAIEKAKQLNLITVDAVGDVYAVNKDPSTWGVSVDKGSAATLPDGSAYTLPESSAATLPLHPVEIYKVVQPHTKGSAATLPMLCVHTTDIKERKLKKERKKRVGKSDEKNVIEKTNEKTAKKRTLGCRLPDDFILTDELQAMALAEGYQNGDAERLFAKFRDYWVAIPGQRGIKLDWTATWRNWVRTEKDRNGGFMPKGRSTNQEVGERWLKTSLAQEQAKRRECAARGVDYDSLPAWER